MTPVGNEMESFWSSITSGVCGIGAITKFDTTDYKVKIAAEIKDFDPILYFEKSQVRKTDLYTQYGIAAASMAMKNSGLAEFSEGLKGTVTMKDIDPERLGVYVGSGIGGMNTFVNETEKLLQGGPSKVSPFFIPMMIGNIAAGTIAIQYGAKGPCLPVVTACATGSHAIGEAYHAIRGDRADVIIAGGCEASITPIAIAGFTNCMALTKRNDPTCASIPFDKRRDGFVIAEGSGILVLEELEHAKQRGATIYGEIAGYGNTCDAYHITAPDPTAQGAANCIKIALKEAFRDDSNYEKSILESGSSYINAHGTSTPLNDKTETMAIKKALGEDLAYKAMISSTKSMTGHMLSAAGAVEAIIVAKALAKGIVPPTIGYVEEDEECDLDCVPNTARHAFADLGLSISLGFGGHNACIAIRPARLI